MKTLLHHEPGKQNLRLHSKSAKRKLPKSPLKIREKIKELQEQHRHTKRVSLSKDKHGQKDLEIQSINKGDKHLLEDDTRKPFQHCQKEKQVFRSSDKKTSNLIPSTSPHKMENKSPAKPEKLRKNAENKLFLSQKDLIGIEPRPPTRVQSSQEGLITQLKEENNRYKRIYSNSLQKLEKLQEILKSIKMQHQAQKNMLEGTVGTLKKKIEERRYNIAHIYSYKNGNFMVVNEGIITETDNENSSSILETFSKRFQRKSSLSDLSIESK